MKGDILIINENHRQAARQLYGLIQNDPGIHKGPYFITIAGESGAGKSEIASALEDILLKNKISAYVIQQDDYFEYPPLTNARRRMEDIRRVGPREVRIDEINRTISEILAGNNPVIKPLVIFAEDRITTEAVDFIPYKVIIVEGTYTTLAENVNCKVFIDRDLYDTQEDRLKRNREKQDDYLEKILEIEHGIINKHKSLADIVISRDYSAFRQK